MNSAKLLRRTDTLDKASDVFYKGRQLLFALQSIKSLQKVVNFKEERVCYSGANSFLLRQTSVNMGGKNFF